MKKIKWSWKEVIGKRRVYARMGRGEIIVRVENDGDTSRYAEYGYPKIMGVISAARLAAVEVPEKDILPEESR